MKRVLIITLALVGLTAFVATAQADWAKEKKEAQEAVADFKKADPTMDKFFKNAAGYAVFPTVTKGAVGVGAARGGGVVYEKGKPVGRTTLTQVTVGFQLGGQAYREIIFFEDAETLDRFKRGKFEIAAQVSAVAATAGASADAKYTEGVAVFTTVKGGLMYEASIGGQKFSYEAM
jgi:lipid-binding SYLF domain-containing protein